MAKIQKAKIENRKAETGGMPGSVREWLAKELAACEQQLRTGPGGMGWKYNEPLRPAIEARAAWLRAALNPQPSTLN